MSDHWDDAFLRERVRQIEVAELPPRYRRPEDYRIAGWTEIASWCREHDVHFDGNIHTVNQARKARGRKPYAIAKGPLQSGLRV